jgi:hypothetical protein
MGNAVRGEELVDDVVGGLGSISPAVMTSSA